MNIILDMIGGAYFNRNLKSLTMDGRLVIIALQGGAKAEQADLARIMTRRLTVTGSSLRPRDSANKARIAHELHEHVWPLLDNGSIKPLIHAVFPLARTDAAHAALEEGNHTGKIVLSVSAD